MKKTIKTMLMATAIVLLAVSCKDETPTPTTNNNNNGGGGTTAPEQYILMNGLKVKIKNPANGSISVTQGDTILTWAGNKPATLNGDSFVIIRHNNSIVKRGVNTIDDGSATIGDVEISIVYGQTASATGISSMTGDFKLEKVNGIWYSVLKNGAGEATKGSTKINLTGIEFRIAWPSTFK